MEILVGLEGLKGATASVGVSGQDTIDINSDFFLANKRHRR